MVKRLIDLIYPRRCPLCGDILGKRDLPDFACGECRRKLPYIPAPTCMRCGKHIEQEDMEYCRDCKERVTIYEKGFPAFVYKGDLKKSVLAFKYRNKRENADFYAREIARLHGDAMKQLGAEALVPIPVHKKRLRTRGYNQAEVLAKALEKELSIPCRTDILVRVENTQVQKDLPMQKRRANLKNAFKRIKNGVDLRKVILVDDIYTTGATVSACATILKATGAEEVYYTSICIGNGMEDSDFS